MNWSAALLLALLTAGDPRIPLLQLQIEKDHRAALEIVDRTLAEDPQAARHLGFDYLRGHLLLQLDRQREAVDAFVTALSSSPQLDAYSRYRLAVEQEKLGHPEVAAGLIARLVHSAAPPALRAPAIQLLVRTLANGGDCRLLRNLDSTRFDRPQRRLLQLAEARCALRDDEPVKARRLLLELLEERRDDDPARLAAHLLRDFDDMGSPRADLLIGLSFHNHREFDLAIAHLADFRTRAPAHSLSQREIFESRYALARSHFWQENFSAAAAHFGALASITTDPRRRAQSLYQQARCYELLNSWDRASAVFQRVYQAEPDGNWAPHAVLSYLRLQWRLGHKQEALQALEALVAERHHASATRALLFLASSELVQGRTAEAEGWLDRAGRLDRGEKETLAYWRGRLFELRGAIESAADAYLVAVLEDSYHPIGQAAHRRLKALRSTPEVEQLGRRLADSTRHRDLYAAWMLLGETSVVGNGAREKLTHLLAADPHAAPFLDLSPQPLADWKMWRSPLHRPEEQLLALGIFREGAPVLTKHFPLSQPALAFTGSQLLYQAGEVNRSLYLAEVLAKRIPTHVPARLLPHGFRRLLYPMGYGDLITAEARKQQIDPYLLLAIIREESRFAPSAFSGAAARGLTQFTFQTARRIGSEIDLDLTDPRQVEQPEVAIALGAAYLRQLDDRFSSSRVQTVAAYNAGEPQSELWRRYCFSDEPEEYLSKVAFKETRGYLRKVLTSYAHYRDLYGPPATGER